MSTENLNDNDMVLKKEFFSILLSNIKKQGLSFLIIVAALFYMHNERVKDKADFQSQLNGIQKRSDVCNDRVIKLYEKQQEGQKEMIDALNRFSQAYEMFTKRKGA